MHWLYLMLLSIKRFQKFHQVTWTSTRIDPMIERYQPRTGIGSTYASISTLDLHLWRKNHFMVDPWVPTLTSISPALSHTHTSGLIFFLRKVHFKTIMGETWRLPRLCLKEFRLADLLTEANWPKLMFLAMWAVLRGTSSSIWSKNICYSLLSIFFIYFKTVKVVIIPKTKCILSQFANS